MMKKSMISAATAVALAASLNAATVDILTDENNGCFCGAGCSLREAIFDSAGGTVTFGVTGSLQVSTTYGAIQINDNVTIQGSSGIDFAPDANTNIFAIGDGSIYMPTVNIDSLTVNNANLGVAIEVKTGSTLNLTNSSVINNTGDGTGGAAIKGDGNIMVDQCSISSNNAGTSNGGAFYSYGGTLTITNSQITDNNASGGGAFAVYGGTAVSIADSNISGNYASYDGGAVNAWSAGSMTVSRTTLQDNSSGATGGAISVSAFDLNISESIISGNIAGGNGGGINSNNSNVMIEASVLSGNHAPDYPNSGGAVYAAGGTVSVSNSDFTDNTVYNYGGAMVLQDLAATIVKSRFTGNGSTDGLEGGGPGGAVFFDHATGLLSESNMTGNIASSGGGAALSYGSLLIEKSMITHNMGSYAGGGVYVNSGKVTIAASTISENNSSMRGGGVSIDNYYATPLGVDIVNTTISGNTAMEGGGGISLYDNSYPVLTELNVSHSTITGNLSGQGGVYSGGGIYNYLTAAVTLKNTIVANNTDSNNHGPDLYGNFISAGNNLITTDQDANISLQATDINGTDPLLLPLGDNGGPTWTHALDTLSPAYGAGDPTNTDISGNPVATDQRGQLRPVTPPPYPTIGAFEPQAAVTIPTTAYDFGTVDVGATSSEYTITVTNSGEAPMTIDNLYMVGGSTAFGWNIYSCTNVASNASCTVGVTFSPADALTYSDSLVIASTTSGLSATVPLSGTGQYAGTSTFTGTMTLPSAATGDLYIEIFAEETDSTGASIGGDYGYGTAYFSSGATSASSSVTINNTSGYYKVGYRVYQGDLPTGYLDQAYIGSSGQVWAFSDARVFTASELQSGVALSMLQGLTLTGTVSLPSGVTASSDLPVHVDNWYDDAAMGGTGYDYYYGWDDVVIPAGQTSVSYSIAVPDTTYGWRVEYWLDEYTSPTNLYNYGYYSSAGTTPYYEDSTLLYTSGSSQSGIDLALLSAYTVSGTITKPSAYTDANLSVDIVAGTTDHKGFGWSWADLNSSVSQVDYTFKVPTGTGDFRLGYEFYNYYNDTTQGFYPLISRGYYSTSGTTPYESQGTLLSNTGNQTGINLQMLEGVLKTGTLAIDQATLDTYYGGQMFAETNTDRIGSGGSYIYDSASGLMTFGLVLPSDMSNFRIGVELYNMDSSVLGYLAADGSTVGDQSAAQVFASVNDVGTVALSSSGVVASPGSYTDQVSCESAGYFWTGTYCTYSDTSSDNDFRIEFGHDITAAEYTAAAALDPSFLSNTEMYMLSYESYSGYSTEKFSIAGTAEYTWSIYDFNPTTLAYDTLSESLTFTKGSNYVLSSSKFDIKYIGTRNARDVNATVFGALGNAYQFDFYRTADEYEFYEQQTDYMDMATYTGFENFLLDFSTGYSYYDEKEGTYDTGLGFSYSTGATSGNLVEIQNGIVSNTNAGTWEIVYVADVGGDVLLTHPTDTTNYHDGTAWTVKSDGYLYRGELQKAGQAFNFYLFDRIAHDEFAQYIAATYGVAVPGVGFSVAELLGQTFYFVRTDGTYGVITYSNDGSTRTFTSGSFASGDTTVTQSYTINSSGQIVIGGTTTVTLLSKTADYISVQVTEGGSSYQERIFTSQAFAQSYLDTIIPPEDTTLSLSFSAGWNLLSLPAKAHLDAFELEFYFATKAGYIDYLAKYGVAGWSYYLVDKVDPTVSRFTTLSSGEGFWLRATAANEVIFTFAEDTAYANEVRPLRSGWNLVGVNRDMTAADLKSLYGAYAVETMWIYDGGVWKVYTGLELDVTDDTGAVVPKFTDVTRTDGIWVKVK